MDKFRFENIKEKLKMKLEQIALENESERSRSNILRGTKRKFSINSSDNGLLNKVRGDTNREAKTFIKVKRFVPAQPKPEVQDTKENTIANEENAVTKEITKSNVKINDSISFETLHKNVRSVKLPSKNWKIKMFMTEKKQPLKIVFTNKDENERCVSFSYCSSDFVITFSGYTVSLIGAPKTVSSVDDISILLCIVDKISVIDPILEYL